MICIISPEPKGKQQFFYVEHTLQCILMHQKMNYQLRSGESLRSSIAKFPMWLHQRVYLVYIESQYI